MSAYCLITRDHCYGLEVVLYRPVTVQWQPAEPFNKHSDTELLITVCVCNKNDPFCLNIGENNHTTQNQQPIQHVILFLSFPVCNTCPLVTVYCIGKNNWHTLEELNLAGAKAAMSCLCMYVGVFAKL